MSTRSGRVRTSAIETSPSRTRKGLSPQRSPRKKASSPARSPSRKSPARKSPSRKTSSKFPARKSPSRTTKEITEKIESPPIVTSPAKRISIRTNIERVHEEKPSILDALRARRPQRSEYSVKDVSVGLTPVKIDTIDKLNGLESSVFSSAESKIVKTSKYSTDFIPRRSSRLREVGDDDPDLRKSLSKSISKSIETFSDTEHSEEEFKKESSQSQTRKLVTPLRENIQKISSPLIGKSEFGGRFGHFVFMFSIPLTVFAILILCDKNCAVEEIDVFILKNSLFRSSAWILLIAQVILQTILAAFPIFGTRAYLLDESKRTYCFNAFFSSIVSVILLFGLDYCKMIQSNEIPNDVIPLAINSYIISVLVSFALYVKSYKSQKPDLNPYGNTGYMLNDFFIGREINPKYKNLYFKILMSRICNINSLVLLILLFRYGINISGPLNFDINTYKDTWSRLHYQPTILIFSMMQIVYLLNFITKEHQIVATFYWQQEGLGYLQVVSSGLYPFYFVTISKSIVDGGVSLPTDTLIGAIILYLVGLAILSASNTFKYEVRKNPGVIHMDTMPTFYGKRILLSTLWGIVRHPNYTGDIMIHSALALPGLLSGRWVASLPALLTILVLVHRAWRDHVRCQRKYGAAWQRYCKKVPSVIIPKVL